MSIGALRLIANQPGPITFGEIVRTRFSQVAEGSYAPVVLTGQESTTQWQFRDFALAIIGGLIGGGLVWIVSQALGADAQTLLVLVALGQTAGHLVAIWLLARRRGGAASLGFTVEPIDVAYLGMGVLLQLALPFLLLPLINLVGDGESGQAISEAIRSVTSLGFRVAMAGVVTVLAPITEELMFRGMLLKTLSLRTIRRGIWLSALIFAIFHVIDLTGDFLRGVIITLPAFLILGVILARVTVRRGRLGPAIFIHSGFNLLALLVLYIPPEGLSQASGS